MFQLGTRYYPTEFIILILVWYWCLQKAPPFFVNLYYQKKTDSIPILRMDTLTSYIGTIDRWLHLRFDATSIPIGHWIYLLRKQEAFLRSIFLLFYFVKTKIICLKYLSAKDYDYNWTPDWSNLIAKLYHPCNFVETYVLLMPM
jgi:hypothetical protein